ncbi:mechanosensitive ion channel family protein [Sphingomonas oligophenolica]|uniref:Small-conductance mechanosensitive channel n=1 Tax=Sphingomonas oligophenolica TaxID=301154 RepID=A0A502CQJ5_9SPHN|nr:mechanosensitive ion channel family protein [Sphingomonas oligophenolica]TPG15497.1 mechanosensitive ion channel family protein [Sphingomonas oligophenolica]
MQPVAPPPVKNPIDLIVAKLHVASNSFFLQLPNIIGGIVFILVMYVIGRLVARGLRALFHKRGRLDLGSVLGSLAFGAIMIVAVLFASAIIFPSVQPATIISSLGIGSVAIGFAFKDILQNLLAGILLLVNRPYRRGDQIVVKDFEGTVEHIESRATLIKTYDGRRVIIPNSDVYTSPVVVNTAFEHRRDQFDIGIGYGDKPARSADTFLAAIAKIEGVLADPAPEVLPWGLDDNFITLRARWWTDSTRTNVVHIRSKVVLAIWEAASEHGIDLPYPTSVILFHDQTEETDGDRTAQREGWPAGKKPPKPRRRAQRRESEQAATD